MGKWFLQRNPFLHKVAKSHNSIVWVPESVPLMDAPKQRSGWTQHGRWAEQPDKVLVPGGMAWRNKRQLLKQEEETPQWSQDHFKMPFKVNTQRLDWTFFSWVSNFIYLKRICQGPKGNTGLTTPALSPGAPPMLPTAQDPMSAPWGCQCLPQWCCSRTDLQLSLPCSAPP